VNDIIKKLEHTLNGYGLIQIKPRGERARRGTADRGQHGNAAGVFVETVVGNFV